MEISRTRRPLRHALDQNHNDALKRHPLQQLDGGSRLSVERRGQEDHPTATLHRVIAQDDLVVVHLTLHGRHVASSMPLLADLPPTRKAIAWDFIHIWRVADELIAEHWACRIDVGLLAQVGGWRS